MAFISSYRAYVIFRRGHSFQRNLRLLAGFRAMSGILKTGTQELNVQHDTKNNEFVIELPSDVSGTEMRALLQYEWHNNRVMNMYHTEVPAVFQGRGIAKILCKEALNFAVEEGIQIIPSCTYVAKYIKDNPKPEYISIVKDELV